MNKEEPLPVWMWRVSVGLLIAALLLTLGLLSATLAGVADPPPLGSLTVEDHFEQPAAWQIRSGAGSITSMTDHAAGRYRIRVEAGSERILVTGPYLIHPPCTIELSAQQIAGASDVAYGLWWGQPGPEANLLAEVNSDGYLGIGPGIASGADSLRNWELFPHVRSQGQVNVFRADVSQTQVMIRLNDEVAGQFTWAAPGEIMPGLLIQSPTGGGATIDFLVLKVWAAHSP
jgi:hypothetical protein